MLVATKQGMQTVECKNGVGICSDIGAGRLDKIAPDLPRTQLTVVTYSHRAQKRAVAQM
jgi:hypothetical protein